MFRLFAGLVAGSLTVALINYFVWPGTLVPGLVGVASAVTVLSFGTRKA